LKKLDAPTFDAASPKYLGGPWMFFLLWPPLRSVNPPAVLLLVIINVNSGESYHNTPSQEREREKTTERRTMVAALLKNRATPPPTRLIKIPALYGVAYPKEI
jgi:hypothetical protein